MTSEILNFTCFRPQDVLLGHDHEVKRLRVPILLLAFCLPPTPSPPHPQPPTPSAYRGLVNSVFSPSDNHNDSNGWLLHSAKLSVKKTQCASTHHSRKYTHRHKYNLHTHTHTYTHTRTHARTHTHIMVRLDLWKCLLKKESFELGFEVREGGEYPLY